MADVHSSEIRSYNMSRIRSRNTKPELIVRKFLFHNGFRYRINDKRLPGIPDIVLPKYKTIIFVHGCFWHGHEGCDYFVIPKTRTEWWMEKIRSNKDRDRKNQGMLLLSGWKIIVIWECELKSSEREKKLNQLLDKLKERRPPE